MSNKMRSVAHHLLENNMGATADETLLVVTDTEKEAISYALVDAGRDLEMSTGRVVTTPLERNGMEPPTFVSAAMCEADVIVAPTAASLTHTRARERANEAGARVATMPGITERMFGEGAVTADYSKVKRLTASLTERLTDADEARIEAGGHALTMSLAGRDGIPSDGIIRKAGASGNLPSGEAYTAPVEDTASGAIAFDGGLAGIGTLDESLIVYIKNGSVTDVGGPAADEFLNVTGIDPCARRVAELGLGTNPSAEIIGAVLEDEKVYGTCHIAFGDNHGFGGTIKCDSHLDGIVLEPEVYLDNKLIVSGGEIVV